MARVTDRMVEDWLIWARNYNEIISWRTATRKRKGQRSTSRRFRIRLTPGVTVNGWPFRASRGIIDITGHRPGDVVPAELMFTAREALAFGMGCAAGRAAALAGLHDKPWQIEDWTPAARAEFKERYEAASEENKRDLQREADERSAEREEAMAEYQRRKEAKSRILTEGSEYDNDT